MCGAWGYLESHSMPKDWAVFKDNSINVGEMPAIHLVMAPAKQGALYDQRMTG
jgi:hypothetical protein